MATPGISFELRGIDAVDSLLLRLSDFRRMARIPLNAALGAAKDAMVAEVPSRKAKRAIKVRVHNDGTGLVGYVGPVGGAQRPGYLAALFSETGTGEYGPKHRPILPAGKQAMAFFSQQAVSSNFGPSAMLFTPTGRLSARAFSRYGNAGQVVVRSTRGAPAHPWFARSMARARPLVAQRFAEKWHEQILGLQQIATR